MGNVIDAALVSEAGPYLQSWLDHQRGLLRTPGVQAAIRVGDELVFSTALGYANEPAGTPLRTDHLFRIASHSKTFTAVSIMQLVERSKIRLDDPIGSVLPEIADSPVAPVTVRELLGHQGGVIRDSVDRDFWQLLRPFPSREELIELVRDHGRVFGRNEHFKYSNVGFSLLGMAIEAVSGQSYADYVSEHILSPLGLTDTGPEYDPERADQYAAGHSMLLDGNEPREAIGHVDTRAMAAATGFYSTAEELSRYATAHYLGNEELITDDSRRLLQRQESVITAYGRDQGRYGLGMILTKVGSREFVGHSGGYPGHITMTYIQPEEQLVITVLTNCSGGPAQQLAQGLIKLLELAADPPEGDTRSGLDLSSFTGRFAGLMGVTDIALLGGRLVGLSPGPADPTDSFDELDVLDADTLRVAAAPGFGSSGELVQLNRDESGTPVSIRYGGGTAWPIEEFKARRSAQIAGIGPAPRG